MFPATDAVTFLGEEIIIIIIKIKNKNNSKREKKNLPRQGKESTYSFIKI